MEPPRAARFVRVSGIAAPPVRRDVAVAARLLLGQDGLKERRVHERDARTLREKDRHRRPWNYGTGKR